MERQRVLVIEDHEPLLMAIREILEAEGYAVSTATDGLRGLEVMERVRPDLIVADIMMPNMDGYAFFEAVRSRPEWTPIPFIFLTAKTEREDVLKGKGMGAEDYLAKPFDTQELLVVVRARLGRARAIREVSEAEFARLKQQIVTVLGHELRTPLTYISGYTELALEEISTMSPEMLQEFLLGIKRGADRLVRLVEDILLLVRLDTGRAAEEFRMLAEVRRDVATVVRRAVEGHATQAAARGVTLETEIAPDLPPVRFFEPFLQDALGRLVENGIKFSLGAEKRVTVTARPANGGVEVAITDRGVGISPEDAQHLFERFRQFGRERMEQQGAGLGLAIAWELIRLHNGTILVESQPGLGSTFTVCLPPAEAV